jgi:hypothetical protein
MSGRDMHLFALHKVFSIAENSQEIAGFPPNFGLTGGTFGRCFRLAAAALMTARRENRRSVATLRL